MLAELRAIQAGAVTPAAWEGCAHSSPGLTGSFPLPPESRTPGSGGGWKGRWQSCASAQRSPGRGRAGDVGLSSLTFNFTHFHVFHEKQRGLLGVGTCLAGLASSPPGPLPPKGSRPRWLLPRPPKVSGWFQGALSQKLEQKWRIFSRSRAWK